LLRLTMAGRSMGPFYFYERDPHLEIRFPMRATKEWHMSSFPDRTVKTLFLEPEPCPFQRITDGLYYHLQGVLWHVHIIVLDREAVARTLDLQSLHQRRLWSTPTLVKVLQDFVSRFLSSWQRPLVGPIDDDQGGRFTMQGYLVQVEETFDLCHLWISLYVWQFQPKTNLLPTLRPLPPLDIEEKCNWLWRRMVEDADDFHPLRNVQEVDTYLEYYIRTFVRRRSNLPADWFFEVELDEYAEFDSAQVDEAKGAIRSGARPKIAPSCFIGEAEDVATSRSYIVHDKNT